MIFLGIVLSLIGLGFVGFQVDQVQNGQKQTFPERKKSSRYDMRRLN